MHVHALPLFPQKLSSSGNLKVYVSSRLMELVSLAGKLQRAFEIMLGSGKKTSRDAIFASNNEGSYMILIIYVRVVFG